ncbi:MAG: hypothetical protein PHW10_02880 [Candidatus Peribacteraceae bacterium]|nr:hypothetical protein [Candidatus Peribacteraceae bacterium]
MAISSSPTDDGAILDRLIATTEEAALHESVQRIPDEQLQGVIDQIRIRTRAIQGPTAMEQHDELIRVIDAIQRSHPMLQRC